MRSFLTTNCRGTLSLEQVLLISGVGLVIAGLTYFMQAMGSYAERYNDSYTTSSGSGN
ncbi:hypothetical protein JNK13_08365 [bacterium]|nr:hypothetical protein [bacterium]